uniref:Uncharacterized protein n=1 Tax=Seriola lalandi dorsalis TaxID=1841481 RepID=A0A3B4WH45_SERLL
VMTLILSIQRSLDHQLWIYSIVIISRDLVVMCNSQREAKTGRVVIDVLYINLDHAYFLVVGKHLHRELALWVAPSTLRVNVHQMWCRILQHSEVRFFPSLHGPISGIFCYIAYNSARSLLLRDRIIEIFQCQGFNPQQKENGYRETHPFNWICGSGRQKKKKKILVDFQPVDYAKPRGLNPNQARG